MSEDCAPDCGHSPELFRAAAASLTVMARQAEALGAELCADPMVVERHLTALQTIDILTQHLDQIASVIAAEDPVSAVEQVSLGGLRKLLGKAA